MHIGTEGAIALGVQDRTRASNEDKEDGFAWMRTVLLTFFLRVAGFLLSALQRGKLAEEKRVIRMHWSAAADAKVSGGERSSVLIDRQLTPLRTGCGRRLKSGLTRSFYRFGDAAQRDHMAQQARTSSIFLDWDQQISTVHAVAGFFLRPACPFRYELP